MPYVDLDIREGLFTKAVKCGYITAWMMVEYQYILITDIKFPSISPSLKFLRVNIEGSFVKKFLLTRMLDK